jgi:trans-aconitate 2-methyltransferase
MGDWNPDLYMRFGDERTRPARDLAVRISADKPARVIDIGCGPGNSTAVLAERWPEAEVTGIDSSASMIEQAKRDHPETGFLLADAAAWESGPEYDVVFSNAALQWVPDHETLLPKLFRAVKHGGTLAVQVPANSESPLQLIVSGLAAEEKWKRQFQRPVDGPLYFPASYYYRLLAPLAAKLEIWYTEYIHAMENRSALLSWYKSTGMRPVLEALPDDNARETFQAQVLKRLGTAYPLEPDGKVLFPFRRLFFTAVAR